MKRGLNSMIPLPHKYATGFEHDHTKMLSRKNQTVGMYELFSKTSVLNISRRVLWGSGSQPLCVDDPGYLPNFSQDLFEDIVQYKPWRSATTNLFPLLHFHYLLLPQVFEKIRRQWCLLIFKRCLSLSTKHYQYLQELN